MSSVAWANMVAPPPVFAPITQNMIPGIRHLDEIDSKHILVRGGRPPSEAEIQQLADNGVKFIINLQGGDYSGNEIIGGLVPFWEKGEKPEDILKEEALAKAAGMDYISLPLNSLKKVDTENFRNILEALKILHQYEVAGGNLGRIFIHCAHGVDRTGLIVALYRVVYQGWDADAAYAEWRLSGHSLANMTATWHLDEFFFAYMKRLSKTAHAPSVSGLCEYNLSF